MAGEFAQKVYISASVWPETRQWLGTGPGLESLHIEIFYIFKRNHILILLSQFSKLTNKKKHFSKLLLLGKFFISVLNDSRSFLVWKLLLEKIHIFNKRLWYLHQELCLCIALWNIEFKHLRNLWIEREEKFKTQK